MNSTKTNTSALYDLSADPGEQNDLSQARPDLATTLHAGIDAWQAATRAPVPSTPNPEYIGPAP